MNQTLVGSILGRHSIKTAHFVPIRIQTWPPQAILVSGWSISKNLLLWNCLANWSQTWWEAPMEGSVLSFLKAEWKVSVTGSAHWASSLCCPIMCLYIQSSMFWCLLLFIHKNDVRFVFASSCLWEGSFLICVCLHIYSGVQHILCCVFVMFVFVLPVSLDCPFLFASSVFSNIYLHSIAEDGVEKMFKTF
jgi:hypothetical protein